jgi:hypothetical protein
VFCEKVWGVFNADKKTYQDPFSDVTVERQARDEAVYTP